MAQKNEKVDEIPQETPQKETYFLPKTEEVVTR